MSRRYNPDREKPYPIESDKALIGILEDFHQRIKDEGLANFENVARTSGSRVATICAHKKRIRDALARQFNIPMFCVCAKMRTWSSI